MWPAVPGRAEFGLVSVVRTVSCAPLLSTLHTNSFRCTEDDGDLQLLERTEDQLASAHLSSIDKVQSQSFDNTWPWLSIVALVTNMLAYHSI